MLGKTIDNEHLVLSTQVISHHSEYLQNNSMYSKCKIWKKNWLTEEKSFTSIPNDDSDVNFRIDLILHF